MEFAAELAAYVPRSADEAVDVARVRALAAEGDPFGRALPVHVTGSALVVHPPTGRVLLRWHERMGSWLHLGGHVDPGETSPLTAACREAGEESGLRDLAPWPEPAHPAILQVVVVPVPAGKGEPPHHHADVRYVLATATPDAVVPERPTAPLRWVSLAEAHDLVHEANLREALARLAATPRPHPEVEVEGSL